MAAIRIKVNELAEIVSSHGHLLPNSVYGYVHWFSVTHGQELTCSVQLDLIVHSEI